MDELEQEPEGQRPPVAGAPAPSSPASPAPPSPVSPAPPAAGEVPVTRTGRLWVTLALGLVVLALLLVFIFQNLREVRIHYFTASGSFPLALTVLIAAIAGAVLAVLVGTVRILQLRREVRARGRARGREQVGPPGTGTG